MARRFVPFGVIFGRRQPKISAYVDNPGAALQQFRGQLHAHSVRRGQEHQLGLSGFISVIRLADQIRLAGELRPDVGDRPGCGIGRHIGDFGVRMVQ